MKPDDLKQFSNSLKTRMGACFPGEKAIFRGHDLHQELGDIEWFDLYIYGITGKRFTKNKLSLLETIWTYTSYPDARIWNNRVAALAGSTKSTANLATSASLAVSEAEVYGGGVLYKSISFLLRTNKEIDVSSQLKIHIEKELHSNRGIAGYGRPLISSDERILPILEKAKSLGLNKGPHLKLAYDIEKLLIEGRWRLRINYAAISSALAADIGLSPMQFYQFMSTVFLAGMQPCYTEAVEKPAGTLFPTACHDIKYEGVKKRIWKEK